MLKKYTFYIGWLISLSTVAVSNAAIGQAASQNNYMPPSSEPQHLTVTESGMFFSADDGVHGRELWILDEPYGNPKMVSNISKGIVSTEFKDFRAFGKYLIFTKVIGEMQELWYSDGTEKGTDRISIYQVEPGVGYLYPMFVMKNSFYFVVKNNQDEHQIWTLSHEDLVPSPLFPSDETPYVFPKTGRLFKEGKDFFVFASATNIATNVYRPGLWRSDGTAAGTFELISLEQTSGGMYVTDSMVLFSALEKPELGWELYVSDGTREGTSLLKDIWVGPNSSSPGQFMSPEGQKGVYFSAIDETHGLELWYTEGTEESTRLVYDLFPGSGDGTPYKFTATDTKLFFDAQKEGVGNELWMLEFINNIPVFLQDIYPGPKHSSPYELTRFRNNAIVFSALSPEYGEELWYSSGDPNDTRMLEDLYPGEESSFPYYQVLFKGHIFFVATDPLYGRELRRFSAFDLGIELVADINQDGMKNPSSSPREITPVGNKLFFVADDVVHGSELWVSDGTAAGTHLVKDIFPGRSSSNPAELTSLEVQKEGVYFRADNGTHGVELWFSDGTEEGTKMLHDISIQGDGAPRHFTSLGYTILFVAHSDDLGSELWAVEGHTVHPLMDIRPGKESSNPKDLKMWNGKVYFRADDGLHGEELWVTDGHRANTYMLKDLVELPVEPSFSRELVPFKDSLYFAFNDGSKGDELWSTSADGNDMGLFMDIARK